MKFTEPLYAKLTIPFSEEALDWNQEFYLEWKKLLKKQRVYEEELVTILMLWSEFLTGTKLNFLYRPNRGTDGGEDLIAVDSIGRIHIFECKKDKIDLKTMMQVRYYLMSHIFQNADDYKSRTIRKSAFSQSKIFSYLNALQDQGKSSENNNKLLKTAASNWYNKDQFYLATNKDEYRKKIFDKKDLLVNKNYVYWLVAPEIDEKCYNEINLLRSSGNDVRVLSLDIRKKVIDKKMNIFIQFQKEVAKQRDEIDTKLLNFANNVKINPKLKKENWNGTKILHIEYYEKDRPSSPKKIGGGLKKPSIVSYPNNKEENFITKYLK
ncbi:MAG TPA: hypothetical protein VE912_10320 [Bacteroidales bacterium]|nr:hypothetical protein [Bacteroidales bacterium]